MKNGAKRMSRQHPKASQRQGVIKGDFAGIVSDRFGLSPPQLRSNIYEIITIRNQKILAFSH